MKRSIGCIAIVIGLLIATDAGAQQEQRWEDCYEELMSTEGSEASEPMDYELLSRLVSHPFNINTATKEDLEQLPFLNDQQIADIMEYVYKYRALQSVGELYFPISLSSENRKNTIAFHGETCCDMANTRSSERWVYRPIAARVSAKGSILAVR